MKNKKKILFSSIIKSIQSKAYLVFAFVAILEMIKSKEIKVEQKSEFSEIYIINYLNQNSYEQEKHYRDSPFCF